MLPEISDDLAASIGHKNTIAGAIFAPATAPLASYFGLMPITISVLPARFTSFFGASITADF
jgi:hypothetical protein